MKVTLPDKTAAVVERRAKKSGRTASAEAAAMIIDAADTGDELLQHGGAREGAGRIGDAAKPKRRKRKT